MHTYFINTSPQVSCNQYKDVLLGSLLARKQLIIPEECISLDSISDYSERLARKIDEESDIAEETTLLLFIDVDQEKYDSLDTMRSYAAADELLYSLKAETGLVWKLCELGKQPKKLVYAFSERIPRGRKIQEDLMNSRIWYNFGLPDWREIEKLVCESIDDRDDENNSLVEQINQYLINHVVPNRVIDPTKDICWLPVIQSFSKHVSAAGRSTEKWDEEQWHSNFRSALNNYIQTKLRDSIQNRYAFSIEYWYQTWEDKDSKEKNRSECRLMLFLYAIVYDSIQQQDNPLLTKNRTNKQQSPADAYVIPKADYQAFGNVLADHYQYCRGGTYKDADAPKRIHEELLKREPNERDFIKSIYDPGDLQLIPEKLEQATLGNDYKISMRQIIKFLEQPEENKVKTIKEKEKGIAAQIRKTIRLIRTHCEENSRKIEEYISRITSEYNRVKDEQLEKMPFTVEDCPDFTESGKEQRIRMIDDLDNIQNNVDRLIADAEKELLQPINEIPKPVSIEKEIRQAEEQTAYYLECLKTKMIHLVFWVLFVLAVLIPYIVTSKQIADSIPGYISLGMTAVLAGMALMAGYIIFHNHYHRKIRKVMDQLIGDFICSQKDNKICIENITKLLYKRIPRCYGLHHYRKMLLEYREDSRLRRLKLTYHDTMRDNWQKRIVKLVDNLDLSSDLLNKRTGRALTIDPDKDCADNEKIYILSAEEVRAALGQGDAR